MSRYNTTGGFHSPTETAQMLTALRAINAAFYDSSYHNDEVDSLTLELGEMKTDSMWCEWHPIDLVVFMTNDEFPRYLILVREQSCSDYFLDDEVRTAAEVLDIVTNLLNQ